jgi:tetratricopeptide (TPR) repeat protein
VNAFGWYDYGALEPSASIGGCAYAALTVFQFRRSDYPDSTSARLRIKSIFLGALFLTAAANVSYVFFESVLGFHNNDFLQLVSVLILSIALVVWPMFRLLKPTFGIDEHMPLWCAILKSPWWATPVMWLPGMVWNVGASTGGLFPFMSSLSLPAFNFSIWPLALPIALFFRWRYGERAFVPLLVGTLPLIVQLGEPAGVPLLYTPGGIWPALAILFLARFAADQTFRQRLLRREHLSWPEALLIVALLSASLHIPLGNLVPGIHATLHIDPSFMLAAAAVVIGSARMPTAPFVVAVIAAWLLPDLTDFNRSDPPPTLFLRDFGLGPGDAASILLVLYGARVWRSCAARGVGSAISPVSGFVSLRQLQAKMDGLFLSCGAALVLAILASRLVPAINVFGIDWAFIPDMAATLALMLLTGLIAGNLWADGSLSAWIFTERWRITLRMAYGSMAVFFLYITLARAFGASTLAVLGIGTRRTDVLSPDLGAVGSAACVIGYLALGAALRIIAERDGQRWIPTAFRLWGVQETRDRGGALDPRFHVSAHMSEELSPQNTLAARREFEKAVALDANSADTWAGLAHVLMIDFLRSWNNATEEQVVRAEEAVQKAYAIDRSVALAHLVEGKIREVKGDLQGEIDALNEALQLDPNLSVAYAHKANALILLGRAEEAPTLLRKAIQLSPRDPELGMFYWFMGRAYFNLKDYDNAIQSLKKSVEETPTAWFSWAHLISAYALTGGLGGPDAKAALGAYRQRFNADWPLDPNIREYYNEAKYRGAPPQLLASLQEYFRGLEIAKQTAGFP